MKIRNTRIFTLLIFITFLSCTDESTGPQTLFSVSGYVYYSGLPAENVTVSIDGKYNYTVKTGSDGHFNISGVNSGEHQLNIRSVLQTMYKSADDTTGFTEKTIDISVYENLVLNNLKLPKAVKLFEAKDITESSASISWSPTDDADFREYKLYRHSTSGLDETTGTLAHVSTSLLDTLFIDEDLNPNEKYFYRVFVMNEYGRIGGSNIIHFQTSNVQLIQNSGFEELSVDVPKYWELVPNTFGNPNNYIQIETSEVFEGNNSLKFHHAEESGCWEMWISQDLDKNFLIAGAAYRLSFAFKADFTGQVGFDLIIRNPDVDQWNTVLMNIESVNEWFEHSYEFGLPDDIGNNGLKVSFHFCIQGVKNWWFDNIQIVKSDF